MKLTDALHVRQLEYDLRALMIAQAAFTNRIPDVNLPLDSLWVSLPVDGGKIVVTDDAASQIRALALGAVAEQIDQAKARLLALGVDVDGWLPIELRPRTDGAVTISAHR